MCNAQHAVVITGFMPSERKELVLNKGSSQNDTLLIRHMQNLRRNAGFFWYSQIKSVQMRTIYALTLFSSFIPIVGLSGMCRVEAVLSENAKVIVPKK